MEENNQIVEKITKIINPFIEEMGLSLVDVEYVQDGGYWYVRIFIENLNGDLNIEDCSKLSSKIEDKVEELKQRETFFYPLRFILIAANLERRKKYDYVFYVYNTHQEIIPDIIQKNKDKEKILRKIE